MNDREGELAVAYQNARPRLVRVAYAVLSSRAEAETWSPTAGCG